MTSKSTEHLTGYNEILEDRIIALRAKVDDLKNHNTRLINENVRLAERIMDLDDQLEKKGRRIEQLLDEITKLEHGIKMDGW